MTKAAGMTSAREAGSCSDTMFDAGRGPGLAEFQELFQRAVMTGDDAILSQICDSSRTSRDVLLGVYRHAYKARLIGVLENDYGYLKNFLGEAAFDAMARAYIASRPSRTPNARWFGQQLPEFLSEAIAYRAPPEAADLARVERALNTAFDAEDAPVLGLDALQAVNPDEWAGLVFGLHPSVQIADCGSDAMSLWMAMKEERPVPDTLILDEPVQYIVVWRQETMPRLRLAGAEEAMVLREAQKGASFGALCEMVATYADPETAPVRAAQYLQGWVMSGMLSHAQLSSK